MKPIRLTDRATAQPVSLRTLVVVNGPMGLGDRLAPGGERGLDVHCERIVSLATLVRTILQTQARGVATYMRVQGGAWHLIWAEEGADDGVGP